MSTATRNNHSRNAVTEDSGLSIREENTRELATSAAAASAQYEIQSAIVVANRFPRDEDRAYGDLMKSCTRLAFADRARYQFPRAGQNIEGPSVTLAREAARVFGNIRYGFDILRDDDESITVRGWAWDVQTNARVSQDAHFKKLVFRKRGGWIKPDERDLRELVNKHGSIAERNCLLKIIPSYMVDEALGACRKTVSAGVSKDIDAERRKVIAAFSAINVNVNDLEQYLGCPLKHATSDQIADLRAVYKSIIDGQSRWSDYGQADESVDEPQAPKGNNQETTIDDLLGDGPQLDTSESQVSPLVAIQAEIAQATTRGALHDLSNKYVGPESPLASEDEIAQVAKWIADATEALGNKPK